ncbi:Uncharacterised protein at_DN1579 [Pycnogonum litorale]
MQIRTGMNWQTVPPFFWHVDEDTESHFQASSYDKMTATHTYLFGAVHSLNDFSRSHSQCNCHCIANKTKHCSSIISFNIYFPLLTRASHISFASQVDFRVSNKK